MHAWQHNLLTYEFLESFCVNIYYKHRVIRVHLKNRKIIIFKTYRIKDKNSEKVKENW